LILAASNALWMVFLGRILDGATAGNLALAQAYISDHTKPEDRAKSFAVIGIAFGVGFTIGPALGGWLGHYGMHYPFIAAAAMSLLSICCTATLLPKEGPRGARSGGGGGPGGRRPGAFDFAVYAEYFRRPRLRSLYIQFFFFAFAFSSFISGFALFAERRFTYHGAPWTQREVGYLFAYSGVLGIIWQGGLIGRMVKRWGELQLTVVGFLAMVASGLLIRELPVEGWGWLALVTVVTSFGTGIVRPMITARITQACGPHEQGTALGISGSLSSIAMALGPPAGGVMLDHGMLGAWPLVSAAMAALGLVAVLADTRSAAGDARA
jgi:predicted MFS family arabinose efflux permease